MTGRMAAEAVVARIARSSGGLRLKRGKITRISTTTLGEGGATDYVQLTVAGRPMLALDVGATWAVGMIVVYADQDSPIVLAPLEASP